MARDTNEKPDGRRVSALEWLASGVGLVLTLCLLAILAWQAWREPGEQLPVVTADVLEIRQAGGLYVVAVEVRNGTPATAANVTVSGTLMQGGRSVQQGEFTLDYVPGGSTRRGGLFFTIDPAPFDLELRALGYADP